MNTPQHLGADASISDDILSDLALRTRLRASWPLAGRQQELGNLGPLIGKSNAQAVYLFGPAGVGKTRLAAELRGIAAQRGLVVLRIMGTVTASGVPFGAVAHLLPAHLNRVVDGPIARNASHEAALLVSSIQQFVRSQGNGRAIVFVDDAVVVGETGSDYSFSGSAQSPTGPFLVGLWF